MAGYIDPNKPNGLLNAGAGYLGSVAAKAGNIQSQVSAANANPDYTNQITQLYKDYGRTSVDQGGMDYWTGKLNSGTSWADVQKDIASSMGNATARTTASGMDAGYAAKIDPNSAYSKSVTVRRNADGTLNQTVGGNVNSQQADGSFARTGINTVTTYGANGQQIPAASQPASGLLNSFTVEGSSGPASKPAQDYADALGSKTLSNTLGYDTTQYRGAGETGSSSVAAGSSTNPSQSEVESQYQSLFGRSANQIDDAGLKNWLNSGKTGAALTEDMQRAATGMANDAAAGRRAFSTQPAVSSYRVTVGDKTIGFDVNGAPVWVNRPATSTVTGGDGNDVVGVDGGGGTTPVTTNDVTSTTSGRPLETPTGANFSANLAQGVDPATMTVEGRIQGLLSQNNPVIRQAGDRAMAAFAQRGLLNSSMAIEAAQEAMIAKAIEIAGPDAATYFRQSNINQDAQNLFAGKRLDQAYNLQNAAVAQDYDLEQLSVGQRNKLEQMLVAHGYDLENMTQEQRNTVERMGIEQGYHLTNTSSAQSHDREMAQLNQTFTNAGLDREQTFALQQNYLTGIGNLQSRYDTQVRDIQASDMALADKQAAIDGLSTLFNNQKAVLTSSFSRLPQWRSEWAGAIDMNTQTEATSTSTSTSTTTPAYTPVTYSGSTYQTAAEIPNATLIRMMQELVDDNDTTITTAQYEALGAEVTRRGLTVPAA